MIKKDLKILAIASILGGVLNLLAIIGEVHWYKIFCFLLMGIFPLALGLLSLKSEDAKRIRSLAWVSLLSGLSILIMATSDFYRADNMPFINYLSAAVLIISSVYGLYQTVRVHNLDIVP